MFKKVVPLIDAALVFISKPVAYSLRKRADKNPKFQQFIVKKGQRFHFGDAPVVDEEKAIQNAAKALVVFTMAGTAVVYQWNRTQQRRYRRVFDLLKQERSEVEQQCLVKMQREIREEEQKINDKMWRIKAVNRFLLKEAERVQLEAVNDQNKTTGCGS
ncbi:PREDICTED: uncharacterized protein LOC109230566 [Nicotiana attenuata]|uniref:Uncharacterized protein n=1 Tax=Nicotiana attenuata TaxID=49451 RepID=A0A1J6I9D9_NICAT|nr:PREDICTED: uncharacterized protein LOC109230566 [Nicotiana attenuata]OIT01052.1 hypothetical protein A4A49_27761 [Nicotiana attenuata]